MNKVFLLLGSNLEDRSALLKQARDRIAGKIGSVEGESSIYESEAWGFDSPDRFLNQVIKIETGLAPSSLLKEILQIELDLGRIRIPAANYSSRLIDIDILFYNDEIILEENLTIPHPRIPDRMFTLLPLSEIDNSFIHPVEHKSIGELVTECNDPLKVYPYHPELK